MMALFYPIPKSRIKGIKHPKNDLFSHSSVHPTIVVFLKFFGGGVIIVEAIYLWRVTVPLPTIVINLARTYEKLNCKAGPYRFSG